jgi:hypothetical protein
MKYGAPPKFFPPCVGSNMIVDARGCSSAASLGVTRENLNAAPFLVCCRFSFPVCTNHADATTMESSKSVRHGLRETLVLVEHVTTLGGTAGCTLPVLPHDSAIDDAAGRGTAAAGRQQARRIAQGRPAVRNRGARRCAARVSA